MKIKTWALVIMTCLLTTYTGTAGSYTATKKCMVSEREAEMADPIKTRDGDYVCMEGNGTGGFAVRCNENESNTCYEAVPNAGGTATIILDPCGDPIVIEVPQGTLLYIQEYTDPITGVEYEIHTFEYPPEG